MRTDSKPMKPSISKTDAKKVRQNRLLSDSGAETKMSDSLDKIEGWLNSRELEPPK